MVAVRPATINDASSIARVHVDSWRTTYPGIVSQTFLDGLSYGKRQAVWEQALGGQLGKQFNLVAIDEAADVVGFIGGGPNRGNNPTFSGELWGIYLLHNFQGRGVGRRLVSALAECLTHDGMNSMIVWVLEANPARAFYERLGGQLVDRAEVKIGEDTLIEVAYGWDDIRPLIAGR